MLKYKSGSWYCTHKKKDNSFPENLLRLRNIQNIACFVKPMEVCNFYRGRNVEKLIYQWNYCAKYPVSLQVIGPLHKIESFTLALFVTRNFFLPLTCFWTLSHKRSNIGKKNVKLSLIFYSDFQNLQYLWKFWCKCKHHIVMLISAVLQNLQWKCLHSFPCL